MINILYVPKIIGNNIVPVMYSNSFTINRYGIFECSDIHNHCGMAEIIPDIIITHYLRLVLMETE